MIKSINIMNFVRDIDERYLKLFREKATEHTEFGIGYEIVEPLTTAWGMPYRSENGWNIVFGEAII